MGRPINFKRLGGDFVVGENRLGFRANVDGTVDDCFLVKQTGVNRFILENDSGVQKECVLVDDSTPSVGQCQMTVTGFGLSKNAAQLASRIGVVGVTIIDGGNADTDGDGIEFTIPAISGLISELDANRAVLTCDVVAGTVDAVNISNAGSYVGQLISDEVLITELNAEELGTPARVKLTFGVVAATVTDGGSGYTSDATVPVLVFGDTNDVEITASTAVGVGDEVIGTTVVEGSTGLTTPPTLIVQDPPGNVRKITDHLLYTFDGRVYRYNVDSAADELKEGDPSLVTDPD